MNNGNGYLGSSALQTSTTNQELIPTKPTWTNGYRLKKFSFDNEESCTVIVNDEVTLFLKAGQGFETDGNDPYISSFVIVEASITFNWIGIF